MLNKLNFVLPAENETLGPVCLGCEASSSSVSTSMLKVLVMYRNMTEKSRNERAKCPSYRGVI